MKLENKNLLKLNVVITFALIVLNNYYKMEMLKNVQYVEKKSGIKLIDLMNIIYFISFVYFVI